MKKILCIVVMLSLALVSKADQLAYVSEAQAKKATEFLKKQKEVIFWCACCDDDVPQVITISKVYYEHTGYKDFYQVFIEDKDQQIHELDLAYVHYMVKDKAHCVGIALEFECDPCTEPFDFDIKKSS